MLQCKCACSPDPSSRPLLTRPALPHRLGPWMCVSTPRRCLGNSACGFPVVSLEPAGHPVDSGAAESGCRARLAAPCEARTLRASLFLQVATGSLVGSAVVRNMGRTPCSLLGRPRARLVGTRALETAWRVVPARSPSPDLSAIYDPPSSLRGLAQGRAAWVPLRWSNWCPPGTSETSTGPPPDALVLVLPHRRGNLPWGAKTQSERQRSFICRE
jgi:Domain of unknown function (DUF4232)